MDIILADELGFCIGVKNAVLSAEKKLTEGKEKIYATGPIIHNDFINEKLKNLGLIYISNLDEIEDNASVIIRSHGETKNFYDEAKSRNIKIIDLTCPFVKKIHNLAEENSLKEKEIVIIGDENHPEVKGVLGWSKKKGRVLKDLGDAKIFLNNYDAKKKYIFLAQTTFDLEKFNDIKNLLEKKNKNFQIINTICSATKKRQEAVRALAKKVETMIVIGDKESSNSKKLFEIAKKYCKNSFFISDENDFAENFSLQNLAKYSIIGITAGASVPEEIIKNVRRKLVNG